MASAMCGSADAYDVGVFRHFALTHESHGHEDLVENKLRQSLQPFGAPGRQAVPKVSRRFEHTVIRLFKIPSSIWRGRSVEHAADASKRFAVCIDR